MPSRKRAKKEQVTDLAPKALKAEAVRGGRAGKDKYLVVKMEEVIITSVRPGGG